MIRAGAVAIGLAALACGHAAPTAPAPPPPGVSTGPLVAAAAVDAGAALDAPAPLDAAAAPDAPPAPPPPPAQDDGSTGLLACDAWLHALDDYYACERVPATAKDALRESVAAMRASWRALRDPATPPAALQAASDACKQASDALAKSLKAFHCAAQTGASR